MELFKIKLIPVVKDRNWEIRHIRSGRKEKTCAACNKTIKAGDPSITFVKRTSKGAKTSYDTRHTCADNMTCREKIMNEVGLDPNEYALMKTN